MLYFSLAAVIFVRMADVADMATDARSGGEMTFTLDVFETDLCMKVFI